MKLHRVIIPIIMIVLLFTFIVTFLLPIILNTVESYEVIYVSIYHEGGAFSTPPTTGYVITCKDENEIITFDVISDRMAIYETNASSNIVITTRCGYTFGELYWNQNQHSMQRI